MRLEKTHFSLRNRFLSVSHKQFLSLVDTFKAATEQSFATPCKLQVEALESHRVYTSCVYASFNDPDLTQMIDKENNNRLLVRSDTVDAITKDVWKKSGNVRVRIYPIDDKAAPQSAFAEVELGRGNRRLATFYMQPSIRLALTMMRAAHPKMAVGDGYEDIGIPHPGIPAGLPLGGRFFYHQ